MAIKIQISKLSLPNSLEEMMDKVEEAGVKILPLNFEHITNLKSLPLHHKDPFDRLIISQGQVKNFTIISKDRAFKNYAVKLLWESD
jgi:PIN domain nuclease of toxin-antitoxin system